MMLSREPSLDQDTSFIPDSHGHLGPALIGPSCVGKGCIDFQAQWSQSEDEQSN